MAIKQIDEREFKRPIEMLRKDFAEFAESDMSVVELVGYDDFNYQSVRTAAIKVMHEYDDKIRFFGRKCKFYLSKE